MSAENEDDRAKGVGGTADRRPSQGLQPAKGGIESIKSLIRQLANPPKRKTRRDPLRDRDVAGQGAADLLWASHQRLDSLPILVEGFEIFSEL
jgi:hypothetical protein